MLESFRNILLHVGSWLWPFSLLILAVTLLGMKDWDVPSSGPVRRTVYTGLRIGTWLTIGGLITLVLVFIPAGPFIVFVLFPVAYAAPAVFMLTTALGLTIGVWKNRREFKGRQLINVLAVIMVLIAVGTAWLSVALRWIDEPM